MEKPTESIKLINMFLHPVFIVKDGIVVDINNAAKRCHLAVNTEVSALISQSLEEYNAFSGGYLSVDISIDGVAQLATVMRSDTGDVFHLYQPNMSAELRTMALISQQLRKPLTGILSASDVLRPSLADGNEETKEQLSQINRNIYQLLRKVSNLSSIDRLATYQSSNQQICYVPGIFDDTIEKSVDFISRSNRTLQYTGLNEDIHCLADPELIERAIYNLVSNAIKFSAADSVVTARLTRNGNKLRFSIVNRMEKDADLTNLYARFMRQPGSDDDRYGIGLGIPLVQHIASIHNGTLLMDQPEDGVIRFTLTLPIRQNTENVVRSPIFTFDYLGGHDHTLVELSEILSADLYAEYL